MYATEILMQEHRLIEQVLECLEQGARRLDAGEAVDPQFFLDAAEFVSGFADACHHGKEEDILFVEFQRATSMGEGGPVAVMLQEHDVGRRYTAEFRAAARRLQEGESAAASDIVENVFGYVELLHEHILKEDEILYPMAEQLLGAEDQQKIDELVRQTEERDKKSGLSDRYLQLAASLQRAMS